MPIKKMFTAFMSLPVPRGRKRKREKRMSVCVCVVCMRDRREEGATYAKRIVSLLFVMFLNNFVISFKFFIL